MNILNEIESRLNPEKPTVVAIKKTEKVNYIAVGLLQNQFLKEHKTSVPTTLVVLKGELDFYIKGNTIRLNTFDSYEIPVDELHEVKGIKKQNFFTLVQEK